MEHSREVILHVTPLQNSNVEFAKYEVNASRPLRNVFILIMVLNIRSSYVGMATHACYSAEITPQFVSYSLLFGL
jgi:hypothetical protein